MPAAGDAPPVSPLGSGSRHGRGHDNAVMDPGPTPAREARRLQRGLAQPPPLAARFLLGQILMRRLARRVIAARIVETEAYLGADDPAAHAYRGRTARTDPLWGAPGTIYVYVIYGMYHCLNLSAERAGTPGCVLIRAAEPLAGSGLEPLDCRGPGRLCRALALDRGHSGRSVFAKGSGLWLREGTPPARVAASRRVGITKALDHELRYFDAASAAVSGPRSRGPSWS
jgi:DNA-3-methyladenine glycosylase